MASGLNMYNMNTNCNPWMQLASQGLGMLGGSSMGYGMGSFGALTGMGCGNIFTNCYGEVNYDAVAGYGVATAVINVGMQAWEANRTEQVNYTQELSKVNKEIDTKAGEVLKLEEDNTAQQNKYDAAGLEITKLKGELSTAENNLKDLGNQIDEAKKDGGTVPTELQRKYDAAKKLYEETIPAKIEAQETIQTKAKEAIEANNKKIDKLNAEITKLKEQKLEYERKIAEKGGNDCLKTGFYDKETNPANKKQFKKAANAFIKAQKENNTTDMKKYGAILVEMYESNTEEFKSKYSGLYEEAKKYNT